MQREPMVTWRHVTPTPEVEGDIRTWLTRLEKSHDRIQRCEIVVEAPHRHHGKGALYHVRVKLTVPGEELVVHRDPPAHQAHEDLRVALRDTFRATRRRLQEHAAKVRGDVKTPTEAQAPGRVRELFPDRHYGFIRDRDGRDVYFHENALLGLSFAELAEGDAVRFVEEDGEDGPQASTVRLVNAAPPA